MSHTPGPWKAACFLVTGANGREVTHTGLLGRRHASVIGRSGSEEDEANARLIAAAPDLLETLEIERRYWLKQKAAYEQCEPPDVCVLPHDHEIAVHLRRIEAAIAKAKGEES